jgi:hypothetical protein
MHIGCMKDNRVTKLATKYKPLWKKKIGTIEEKTERSTEDVKMFITLISETE